MLFVYKFKYQEFHEKLCNVYIRTQCKLSCFLKIVWLFVFKNVSQK